MRLSSLVLPLPLLMLSTVHAATATAQPRLRCEVTYAGAPQVVEVAPTDSPYSVPAVDIGGRFLFKAVMVRGQGLVERIGIYVYADAEPQPLLIQHARYLPPYPRRVDGQAVDLTGEQHLYAGPLERELIYRCTLTGGTK